MARSKNRKNSKGLIRDPEKENILRDLSVLLESAGYEVRREKLKRGPGWKVLSGSCRAVTKNASEKSLVFVDRQLPQDDQISFLIGRVTEVKNKLATQSLAQLPEKIRAQIG